MALWWQHDVMAALQKVRKGAPESEVPESEVRAKEVPESGVHESEVRAKEVPEGWQANGVAIDSRTLVAGDLFIALKGPNHDGHDFVEDAQSKGASAAVVHWSFIKARKDLAGTMPLVGVADTFFALHLLAAYARGRCGATIIAITGSSGKTSTKDALARALATQGKTHASFASYNNHWGVPLSLARMPRDAQYGVFELGMNHGGEIGKLSRLVRPNVAVITNVSSAHLKSFSCEADIAKAKGEIFEGFATTAKVPEHRAPNNKAQEHAQNNKVQEHAPKKRIAILHGDSRYRALLSAKARQCHGDSLLYFGVGENNTVQLRAATPTAQGTAQGTQVQAWLGESVCTYSIAARGRHMALNSLAAVAVLVALKLNINVAVAPWARWQAKAGRGQTWKVPVRHDHVTQDHVRHDHVTHNHVRQGHFTLIDESYNANPASMRAAITLLQESRGDAMGRCIAVLADMEELGDASPRLHASLAEDIVRAGVEIVFTLGRAMKHLHAALPKQVRAVHGESLPQLRRLLEQAVRPGDVVMVKGSRRARLDRLVAQLCLVANNEQTNKNPRQGNIPHVV